MKVYRLERVQTLPVDVETAWGYFSDPVNLAKITPPWLNFTLTSQPPDVMYAGLVITYRIRPFLALPVRWTTEITHVDAPRFFVDEQRFGPYRFWHHQHFFCQIAGGTEMRDVVHYALPFGWLGRAAHAVVVHKKLNAIFSYRQQTLKQLFPGRASARSPVAA